MDPWRILASSWPCCPKGGTTRSIHNSTIQGTFYRHFIYTCMLFTRYQTLPCYLALFALAEIFELAMAFDALRLRNIIQLIGILSKHEPSFVLSHVTEQYLVFHGGLIVMGALQVHQTNTALVQLPNCDATVSYIVSWQYVNDAKLIWLMPPR